MTKDSVRIDPPLRHFARPCPSCGYDTRGSPSGICPECGKAFDCTRVRFRDVSGPWWLGLVGLVFSAALYAAVGARGLMSEISPSNVLAGIAALLCIGFAIKWWRIRADFARTYSPEAVDWYLCTLCWMPPAPIGCVLCVNPWAFMGVS
jgi:hypothetical protein